MGRGRRKGDQSRLSLDAHISIIGSGLAGLASAITLERKGFTNLHIFERDASASSRKEGYGLTLSYNPTGPLAELDILEDVAQADCPSRSHYLFDIDGRVCGYFGNAFSEGRGYGQRGNLRVPRQKVRELLFSKLSATKVYWGCKLIEYERRSDEEKYRMRFSKLSHDNQITSELDVHTDFIVASDGIRSTTLALVWPEAPRPKSIDIRVVLGISRDFSHPHLDERGFYTLGRQMRLFVMPFAAKRYMWQLSFPDKRADQFSSDDLYEEVLNKCKDFHQPVIALIKSTPIESVWGTLLYDRDPMALWEHIYKAQCRPRVLVVGDAW